MVGSGAGAVRLYDQHAETEGRAPEGVLRWEAECRPDWAAKYGGLLAVSDINEAGCVALAEDRWAWSGMGTEVAAISRVYELVRSSELPVREQNGLLVFVWGQAARDMAFLAKTSLAKYGRLQRVVGVVVEPGSLDMSHGVVSRLDWGTGRGGFSGGVAHRLLRSGRSPPA